MQRNDKGSSVQKAKKIHQNVRECSKPTRAIWKMKTELKRVIFWYLYTCFQVFIWPFITPIITLMKYLENQKRKGMRFTDTRRWWKGDVSDYLLHNVDLRSEDQDGSQHFSLLKKIKERKWRSKSWRTLLVLSFIHILKLRPRQCRHNLLSNELKAY